MRSNTFLERKGCLIGVLAMLPLGSGVLAQQARPQAQPEAEAPASPTYLINIDTPHTAKQGKINFNLEHRPFGSLENISYTNLGLEFGLTSRTAVVARYGTAVSRTVAFGSKSLLQGGRELELGLRLQMSPTLAAQAGILVPDARPQSKLGIGGELMYSHKFGGNLTAFVTPKVIAGQVLLGTLGGGLEYQFGSSLSLFGDWQRAIIGNNGVNSNTGNAIQKDVWGIGARYNPSAWRGKFSLDLGVTNGLGRSLGMSTSSGLGGSAAVYFGVSIRP